MQQKSVYYNKDFPVQSLKKIKVIYQSPYTKVKLMELDGKFFVLKKQTNIKKKDQSCFVQSMEWATKNTNEYMMKLYYYEINEQYHIIISDYYEKTLHDLIQENFKDNKISKQKILKEILQGLFYLHSNGYCHRDIKPSNIFIDKEDKIIIGDYDSLKNISDTQENTKYISTLYYRAPEIFFGYQNYKYEVDIWSFGCLMAEVI